MTENVPISFVYNGKPYNGAFHPVFGSGEGPVWQLYFNNYYFGNLRYTDHWVFSGNQMHEMVDFFGDYLTAWYEFGGVGTFDSLMSIILTAMNKKSTVLLTNYSLQKLKKMEAGFGEERIVFHTYEDCKLLTNGSSGITSYDMVLDT